MAGLDASAITELRVSPFYFSAVNALTRPNQTVFCSRYFVRRWMPLLGGTGTQVVLHLRSLGYHNRQTGELRDEIPVKVGDIAAACRCSPATIRREFAKNEALKLFVQVRNRWEPDPSTGLPRQCENGYRVAMDDPPHEADLAWLKAYVAQEEAGQAGIPTPPDQNARGVQTARGEGRKLQAPPDQNARAKTPDTSEKDTLPTLNVWEEDGFVFSDGEGTQNDPVASSLDRSTNSTRRWEKTLERKAAALAAELHDLGSERRHKQLLSICEQHGLPDLSRQALRATQVRQAREGKQGVVEKPGAYYQRVLVALLQEHQVFVPTLAEKTEDAPEEVRRMARQSLRLGNLGPDTGGEAEGASEEEQGGTDD